MEDGIDVICSECDWTGRREPSAEYQASVLTPEWQPGDIFCAGYGACPQCGEEDSLVFDLAPTLRALGNAEWGLPDSAGRARWPIRSSQIPPKPC